MPDFADTVVPTFIIALLAKSRKPRCASRGRDEHDHGNKVTIQQLGVLLLITLIIGLVCALTWMVFEAVFFIHIAIH